MTTSVEQPRSCLVSTPSGDINHDSFTNWNGHSHAQRLTVLELEMWNMDFLEIPVVIYH